MEYLAITVLVVMMATEAIVIISSYLRGPK